MAFWSQAADPRRFRSNSRSQAFRETSPETDMFFDSSSGFGFPRGSHLADRVSIDLSVVFYFAFFVMVGLNGIVGSSPWS